MSTSSSSYRTARTFPTWGYYLSIAGAIMFLIQGLIAMFFNSIVYSFAISLGFGLTIFFLGLFLVLDALVIGSTAVGLRAYPGQHVIAGGTIILFSILGLFLGGGYIIGSIFGVIGGILAIMNI